MKPYYEDDLVTLYHGDCLDEATWLSCDVLITDPPYGLNSHLSQHSKSANRPRKAPAWDRNLEVRDRVLSLWGERPYAMFGSPRRIDQAPPHREVPLIWDKGDMVASGDVTFPWRPTYELIYVAGAGWSGYRGQAVIRSPHAPNIATEIGHPTPKPIGLMSELIAKAPAGSIADPFAGSGSTLVAAKALGRKAIGVELEERYAEIAARRLAQGVLDFGGVA